MNYIHDKFSKYLNPLIYLSMQARDMMSLVSRSTFNNMFWYFKINIHPNIHNRW